MDGKLVGMKIDGSYVDCEISCSLRVSNEQLDASGATNGNWKHYIEGYKSWSASVNAKAIRNASPAGFSKIFKKNLLSNQTFVLVIGLKDDVNEDMFFIQGNAKLQEMDFTANIEDKADMMINFIGTGAFTEVTIDEGESE